jgi:stage IV sporulation protein FB
MLIGSVPPTPYDLSFSLFRIPVRVHPLFWLVALLLGMRLPPVYVVIWVAVVFVSILVHEMGHALAIRQFGWWPSILLYTFGGLAMYQPTHRDARKEMMISLAGPLAGFLFAGALIAFLKGTGHQVDIEFGPPYGLAVVAPLERENLTLNFADSKVCALVNFLLEVNIWWGLMNLLPVYPLDGGQFLRELFGFLRVRDAMVKSLQVSIVTAAAVALYSLARVHDYYLAAMFGYLAYTSFQTLQAYSGRGGGYGGW